MNRTTRRTRAARRDAPAVSEILPAPGSLLDWHDSWHWHQEAPCVLCRRPTQLRSHAGEPAHKVCAENWLAAHPDEARDGRFLNDQPRNGRSHTHA